jgi:hypothetical protein
MTTLDANRVSGKRRLWEKGELLKGRAEKGKPRRASREGRVEKDVMTTFSARSSDSKCRRRRQGQNRRHSRHCDAHSGRDQVTSRRLQLDSMADQPNSRRVQLNSRRVEVDSRRIQLNSRRYDLNSRQQGVNSRRCRLNSRRVVLRSRRMQLVFGRYSLGSQPDYLDLMRVQPPLRDGGVPLQTHRTRLDVVVNTAASPTL